MRDYRDAKAMAQTLRQAFKEKSVSLTHSESLELTARVLGLADWNTLSARIDASPKAAPLVLPAVRKPVVAMRGLVLFPDMTTPIYAGRPKSLAAIEQAMAADKEFFSVTQRRVADDDPGPDDLYTIGVIARPLDVFKMPDGSIKMVAQGLRRARVTRFDAEGACLVAELAAMSSEGAAREEATTVSRELLQRFAAHANIDLASPPQALLILPHLNDPGRIADMIAQYLSLSVEQRQQVLEATDVVQRMRMILALMAPDRQAA
ncbi:MAG: LON peptidase substrate-binding domain-containing protein [Rhodospirillales bacterium]|nr:LON peptidase substrate-binding domain-containing protein [Rhodospirillales bacterium]